MRCSCGNKQLEIKTVSRTITINEQSYYYETTLSHCPQCGENWYSLEQSRSEDQIIAAIKRKAYGFLTPQEMKAIREKHGLTLEEAAELFTCRVEDLEKYENTGELPPRYLDKLIRLFDASPEVSREINAKSHYIIPVQPRKTLSERRQPETL